MQEGLFLDYRAN